MGWGFLPVPRPGLIYDLMANKHRGEAERPDDVVYLNGRREAITTLVIWAVFGLYTLTYCYLNGYDRDPEEIETVLGIPDWVFWGVFAPWVVAIPVSWWFAFVVMKDDELGEEGDESARVTDTEVGDV